MNRVESLVRTSRYRLLSDYQHRSSLFTTRRSEDTHLNLINNRREDISLASLPIKIASLLTR